MDTELDQPTTTPSNSTERTELGFRLGPVARSGLSDSHRRPSLFFPARHMRAGRLETGYHGHYRGVELTHTGAQVSGAAIGQPARHFVSLRSCRRDGPCIFRMSFPQAAARVSCLTRFFSTSSANVLLVTEFISFLLFTHSALAEKCGEKAIASHGSAALRVSSLSPRFLLAFGYF